MGTWLGSNQFGRSPSGHISHRFRHRRLNWKTCDKGWENLPQEDFGICVYTTVRPLREGLTDGILELKKNKRNKRKAYPLISHECGLGLSYSSHQ